MSAVASAERVPTESRTSPALTRPLRRVRQVGYALLGLQLAGFLVWSFFQSSRFALTWDFSIDGQAWFLIAHGNLGPVPTAIGYPLWQAHCEFVLWPLALLYWVWPHNVTLLWVQDICVVGAEMVAFTWLCEIVHRARPARGAAMLAGTGLVLLLLNPWTWWSVAWDFHTETVGVLLAALLARALVNGRRRAWAWAAMLLTCGDVAGTYLAGIGAGGVLAGRGSRSRGAAMALLGVSATLVITLIHGNRGSDIQAGYAYLAGTAATGGPLTLPGLIGGIATHPFLLLRTLWARRLEVWANLAPTAVVGAAFSWVLPLSAIVLLASTLMGEKSIAGFSGPGFQNIPLYIFTAAGAVAALCWLAKRHSRLALLLAGLACAQAVGWAVIWGTRTPGQWLQVPGSTATALARVAARIPGSAGVIASQGIMGSFDERAFFKGLFGPGKISVRGSSIWFVITPLAGIETQHTASAMALIGELAGPWHARLAMDRDGVWAFQWRPPPGTREITVPGDSRSLPAWAAPLTPGEAGRPVLTGASATWHMSATGRRGYVADGMAWQEQPGLYQARVSLSTTGPVNVEVWNDTRHMLLARKAVPATTGAEPVVLPVDASAAYRAAPYYAEEGWGPFQAVFPPPPPGERLEVRVWSPGGGKVNVYHAELARGSSSVSSAAGRAAGKGG